MKEDDCCSVLSKSDPNNFVEWETDLPESFSFDDYPTPVERYYSKKYYRPVIQQTTGEQKVFATTCVLLHSNGCCLVCVSPSHELVTNKDLLIDAIDFQTGPRTNRLESKPVGKSKKMAQIIKNEDELICRVVTADGTVFHLAAGVRGRLIEVNEAIGTNPNLIKSRPTSEGYIAIIMPARNGYNFTPNHRTEDTFVNEKPQN